MLTILSLDHHRSTVAEREPFALAAAERIRLGGIARRATGCQVVFLATCNRVELILWSEHTETRSAINSILAIGRRLAPGIAEQFVAAAARHHGDDAVRHLLRVAAGLASRVEGDIQVLGQVRAAYAEGAESGSLGPELHRIMQTTLRAGKRVHHETEFGRRRASVGAAAAVVVTSRLAEAAPRVVLLGTGKAAEAAARTLSARGVRLTIISRAHDRAETAARNIGGVAAPFEERHAIVAGADAAILATGAQEPILTAQALREVRQAAGRSGHPLLLLDLGFPRNVEPAVSGLGGVTLLGLQDLGNGATAGAFAKAAAEQILEAEAGTLRAWLDARSSRRLGAA